MQINIPDELVNRLVTSTDVVREANGVLDDKNLKFNRYCGDTVGQDGARADRLQAGHNRDRAAEDRTIAVDQLVELVYAAGGGKGGSL